MRRGAGGWCALAVLLLLGVVPFEGAAQTVVGRVTEPGRMAPLEGVFVVLEGEAGDRVAGVLTGNDGRFYLRGAAGRFRLVAELIGYGTARTEPFDLEPGETVQRDLELAVQALRMGGIQVSARARCQGPSSGPETARLWEEARKALEVASWSEEQGALQLRVERYTRELDAGTLAVLDETRTGGRGYFHRSPYISLPAERLHAEGYVQEVDGGDQVFYAPDADVLLSDSFLDSHCFRSVSGGADEDGFVGLAFEPVPGREVPDISGVLWLEEGTAELRRMDFRYDRLPGHRESWAQVGGRVEFERLATGMWIVRRWRIRMPRAVEHRPWEATRSNLALVSLTEQGAQVQSVRTAAGEPLASVAGSTLFGRAVADGGERPLAGATVEVVGLDRRTVTGPAGDYRFTGLPDGTYTVDVRHPDLELLGLPPAQRLVELSAGRAVRADLNASLDRERAAALCEAAGDGGWVLLYGLVLSDDAAVPGAVIRLDVDGVRTTLVADSLGAYRTCLKEPASILAGATRPTDPGLGGETTSEVPVTGPGFLRSDIAVREPAPRAAEAGGPGRSQLIGTVRERDTGAPVHGAQISLRDPAGAVLAGTATNENGQFSLAHPGTGASSFTVAVEHVAYGRTTAELHFPTGQQVLLDVSLTTRPIALEPIVVRERRRGLLVDVGYYQRRDRSLGVAVDRQEIEARVPGRVTDLFRGKPGWRVVSLDKSGVTWDVRVSAASRLGGQDCQPAIWVDGNRVRRAGQPRRDPRLQKIEELTLSEIVDPSEVEAIELFAHPSEIPIRYGGTDAACGVILIWRRHGTATH